MALTGDIDEIVSDSAAALADYADHLGATQAVNSPAAVWQMSGVPALFNAISERIASGEGAEMMRAVRRRALNHLQGLKASSSIVSLRLDSTELTMVDTDTLLTRLRGSAPLSGPRAGIPARSP